MRWVYVGAGLLALSASCYMAVMASGGVASQSAPGLIAMAVVLAVGAAAIGHALAGNHTGIAVIIGLGMLAGEAGAMLQTAQRVTAAREAMRAPMAALMLRRRAAVDELTKAEASHVELVDHARLITAEKAKSEAEKAVRDKSAEKGCRQNCRLLLQAAVDSAQQEVDAARIELARRDSEQASAKIKRIDIARAVVATLPAPQSATPLADNTGLPEWLLDTLEAFALSLAINLPASALVALGAKMGRAPWKENNQLRTESTLVFEEVSANVERDVRPLLSAPHPSRRRNPADEAERFGVAMLRPDKDSRLSPSELRAAYVNWCERTEKEPLPIENIAPALGRLFRKAGIDVVDGCEAGL